MTAETNIKAPPPQGRQGCIALNELAQAAAAAEALLSIRPSQGQVAGIFKTDRSDEAAGHSCVPSSIVQPIALSSEIVDIISSRAKEGGSAKRPAESSLQSHKKEKIRRLAIKSNHGILPPHLLLSLAPVGNSDGALQTLTSAHSCSNLKTEFRKFPVVPSTGGKSAPLDVDSLSFNDSGQGYVDYSREIPEPSPLDASTFESLTLSGVQDATTRAFVIGLAVPAQPTFPQILHDMLSNPEFRHIISWMPHGRAVRFDAHVVQWSVFDRRLIVSVVSCIAAIFGAFSKWRIYNPRALEQTVLPLYFRHGVYSSFRRQVNGWGFRR
jgi:HSF-type DNA-binding